MKKICCIGSIKINRLDKNFEHCFQRCTYLMESTLKFVSMFTFLLSKDYKCSHLFLTLENSPELMKIQACMKTRKSLLPYKLEIDFHCLSKTLSFFQMQSV